MGAKLNNLRLVFAVPALTLSAIAMSIAAVLFGLYISLGASVERDVDKAVDDTLRIASEILRVNLPSLEIIRAEDGAFAQLQARNMPRFRSNDVIDAISAVAGQHAAIYVYDPEVGPDFVLGTTTLVDSAGERAMSLSLAPKTPAYEALLANLHFSDRMVDATGADLILHYQPIARADGTVIGALMVGVDRGPIIAVLNSTLLFLGAIGLGALVVAALIVPLVSRLLTRPIAQLENAMALVAKGDLETPVPYRDARSEVGAMARAVDVFRANAEEKRELDQQAQIFLAEATDHTGQLEAISRSQLVVEFNLDGTVISANQNFLSRLGYAAREIVGAPNALFLFDVDPQSDGYKRFWSDLANGEFKSGEYRRRSKTGQEIWIQSTFTPIADPSGKPYKIVQFATDVTARRLAVSQIQAGLLRLADGDLTGKLPDPFPPEFEDLRHGLNDTIDRFADVVGQLQLTGGNLRSATGELLTGANDLSERTAKQAATIVETAAAMESLSETVLRNSAMANAASQKADLVRRGAEDSASVMSDATAAMDRIRASSSKISNVVGLIDDIAFQTNLLALNASVEAARAGEAGKGFAVVAVEVRRLAQNAAQASAEVKGLIDVSEQDVKAGTGMVSAASETLVTMQSAVEENHQLVQSIVSASQEQALAIGEVLTAVRTLDTMTQHNAALVEETNAIIAQTEGQTQTLDAIIDVFELGTISQHPTLRRAG